MPNDVSIEFGEFLASFNDSNLSLYIMGTENEKVVMRVTRYLKVDKIFDIRFPGGEIDFLDEETESEFKGIAEAIYEEFSHSYRSLINIAKAVDEEKVKKLERMELRRKQRENAQRVSA